MRKHLLQVKKTTGKMPSLLKNQPKLPEGFGYIYGWFLELHSGEPLTYVEIQAWSTLTRKNILSWETELLMSLDRIFWRVINELDS